MNFFHKNDAKKFLKKVYIAFLIHVQDSFIQKIPEQVSIHF